mmetsp:Transcript_55858/g.88871  ORF Transcript_55858/g.88871 Transcript_55858/m.88871 type:complete len:308 (+) Transcript_55858:2384-3307(+)
MAVMHTVSSHVRKLSFVSRYTRAVCGIRFCFRLIARFHYFSQFIQDIIFVINNTRRIRTCLVFRHKREIRVTHRTQHHLRNLDPVVYIFRRHQSLQFIPPDIIRCVRHTLMDGHWFLEYAHRNIATQKRQPLQQKPACIIYSALIRAPSLESIICKLPNNFKPLRRRNIQRFLLFDLRKNPRLDQCAATNHNRIARTLFHALVPFIPIKHIAITDNIHFLSIRFVLVTIQHLHTLSNILPVRRSPISLLAASTMHTNGGHPVMAQHVNDLFCVGFLMHESFAHLACDRNCAFRVHRLIRIGNRVHAA